MSNVNGESGFTQLDKLNITNKLLVKGKPVFNPTTDMVVKELIVAFSATAPQEPAGLGVANSIVINFGPSQGDINDPVMLNANGELTVNDNGTYLIRIAVQFGRSGASGVSLLMFRSLINGFQIGNTIAVKLNNSNVGQFNNLSFRLDIDTAIGDKITFELMRDASGDNSGGLFGFAPTVDGGDEWSDAPSASLNVERWELAD